MNIFAVLANTPFWVWALLIAVVMLGLRLARERTVTASRLVLLPLLLVALAVSTLATATSDDLGMTGAIVGLLAGGLAGVRIESRAGAERVSPGVLRLNGEWVALPIILAVFLVRYVATAISATDPLLAAAPAYHFVIALLAAFFAALTLARTGLRLRLAYAA
jgi:hypothetical protein